jgi:hypothetical protein
MPLVTGVAQNGALGAPLEPIASGPRSNVSL